MVDIHREDGRHRVQHRGQRRDDGGHEGGDHKAFDTGRDEVLDQPRVGVVVLDASVSVQEGALHTRNDRCALWSGEHDVGDDARNNHDQRKDHFHARGEEKAFLRFSERFRGQSALDDVLVEAPVIHVRDPHPADQHPDAGKVVEFGMSLVQNHVELVARGIHHMGEAGQNAAIGCERVEGDEGGEESAHDKQHDLDHIRPGHRGQAAVQRIGGGQDAEEEDARHEVGAIADAHDGVDRLRAEVEHRGQVHEDEQRDPEHGQNGFQGAVETLLDELRDGVQALLDEDRKQELGHEDEREGRHPFVRSDGQADGEARTRHADELLGRDVRGDERGADSPPGQCLTGEEIVVGVGLMTFFGAGDPQSQSDDGQDVKGENDDVDHGAFGAKCESLP